MRIHMQQMNPVIGDFQGNLAKIKVALDAHARHVDMIVFPELSLCGYYPQDFLEKQDFLDAHDRALAELVAMSADYDAAIVVGCIERNPGAGKALFNSLQLLHHGRRVLSYHKRLLPTYNIFDERRHFEPGHQVATWDFKNERVGFIICEDGWNDDEARRSYEDNPVRDAVESGATILVTINASPSHVGKPQSREKMFCKMATRYGIPLVYVNQVGTQDAIGFDGFSFAVDHVGTVRARLKGFVEDAVSLEIHGGSINPCLDIYKLPMAEHPGLPEMFFHDQIVMGLRDYVSKCGFKSVVVGASGGIDSAVTLAYAVEALGPENVIAVGMPSVFSSDDSLIDAKLLADNLGIKFVVDPIKAEFDVFCASFEASSGQKLEGIALQNIQARIRGVKLMAFSNQFNHLLLTTGNKSEVSVGYATLYGDTNGGLNLIGDLYKMEVYALAEYFNTVQGRTVIPQSSIDKAPSAELATEQKDEDSLPPYPLLDALLRNYLEPVEHLQEYMNAEALFRHNNLVMTAPEEIRSWVVSAVERAEYKRRQAPPILRMHAKAFGVGRQVPIAHGFKP